MKLVTHSDRVESLFAPYRDALGEDFAAYRGHVYRCITYAMAFLGQNEAHRAMVETVFVYHDIGLWTDRDLAYLEPSEARALADNAARGFGLDPDVLRAAIHWHHKVTPYRGPGSEIVNAVRKADWIDASGGLVRHGVSKDEIKAVTSAIPDFGFPGVLQRLSRDLGGSAVAGNLRVLLRVFRW